MERPFALADARRVDNLIWAGAHAYDFAPDFVSHDLIGQPDFYMNLIMGCAYYRYGRENLLGLFAIWQDSHRLPFFDQLTWFGLERAIYPQEARERPALKALREDSARAFLLPELDLQRRDFSLRNWLLFELKRAQSLEVLGLPQARMSGKARLFYEAFQFEETPDFPEFRRRLLQLYQAHFRLSAGKPPPSASKRRWWRFGPGISKPLIQRARLTTNLQRQGPAAGKAAAPGAGAPWFSLAKREDERLRARLSYEFGPPLFDEAEQRALEERFARQQHKGSRLWICHQRSAYPAAKSSAELYLQLAAAQKQRTFEAYRRRQAFYRQSIQRLANYLQLMMAADLAPGHSPCRSGKLVGRLAFRASIPGQDQIFHRHDEVPAAEHGVDLLLDASASRLGQAEDIAIQAYILAESLERCTIPVRIVAYCTLEQYTVLTILKDFSEKLALSKLFSYHALGWNRDGLAYRAMQALMPRRPYRRHLILILTDAAPNDIRPLRAAWRWPQPYSGKQGLQDAASGLDALRQPGISIAGLISGTEALHGHVRQLFGNRCERLSDTSQLVTQAKKLMLRSMGSQPGR